jgi:ligand-binding sensor domain-containing protein
MNKSGLGGLMINCACKRYLSLVTSVFFSLLISNCSTFCERSYALDSGKAMAHYIHDAWQTEQGLPQNYVVSITQTRDGYLWLATQEGLTRFDGIKFVVFDKGNTPQFADNNIQALYEDRDGNLWVGTGNGLVRYKGGEFTSYGTKDGLSNAIVDSIYGDHQNNIWIGTPSGLNRFKEGTLTTYTTKDGLPTDVVLSIYEDKEQTLWVGTRDGLSRFADGRFITYTTRDGLSNNLIRAIFEDHDGNLWIGTGGGLDRLKDGKFTTFSTKDGLSNNSVLSLYADGQDTLWIGTYGGGLSRFKDGRFAAYSTKEGLSNNSVGAIYEDREGNLWIGTYGGGLNRLKDGNFITFTSADGLSDEMVSAIYQDREGDVWLGTRGGLNRLAYHRANAKGGCGEAFGMPCQVDFSAYTTRDGLANNIVVSIHQDRQGSLWIGTAGGLNRFKHGRFTTYTTKDGLADDNVVSICEDHLGDLWIGTGGGLSRLRQGKFTNFTTKDGLLDDVVLLTYEDRKGNLWIGTDGGGLARFSEGKFEIYTTKDGLPNDVVLSIYEDREGCLWIGTNGGLGRYKDNQFTAYTTKEGLFDDGIFQILEDEKENLWMSCNKGIFRVSKNELKNYSGAARSITSISYGTSDGLKSRECNGGFQPAGCKTTDGKLWFPTRKGVAVIDPGGIKTNDQPPPVIVEQFIVDNESISLTQGLEISPGKDKFEFRYAGLSFSAPERVKFKYKLEGFDKGWVDANTRREVSYTNIPPGRYSFQVIACNNDGVWNQTGASLNFVLRPHFYETYWFYALCAALVGLMGWGLHRVRLKQVEAEFSAVLAERNRIAREIHDTLAQGFVAVSVQLETVTKMFSAAPDVAIKHLDRARLLVRDGLSEARRSVLDLRAQALEEGDLVKALSGIAKQLTVQTPVELRVSGTPRRLANGVENNLLRIGQEAITNAVRHAQAGHIQVDLHFGDDSVRLRVRDDGRGFDAEAQLSAGGGHLGLIGMRERAEQINGRLIIESSPGQGAEIIVDVPAR